MPCRKTSVFRQNNASYRPELPFNAVPANVGILALSGLLQALRLIQSGDALHDTS